MPHPFAGKPRAVRWAALALLIVAAAALTAGPAVAGSPGSYVALGDSYTAGPLVLPQDPNTPGCFRSVLNYPHLLNARYQFSGFADVSCSGARTNDMFAPQVVGGGVNPPQLDALRSSTKLVTLQIGGNDIGFSEIATSCATLLPLGTPCRTLYAPGGVDEISRRINETRSKVDAVIAAIKQRSPEARIYLIGYPALFPETGVGCWPVMPYAPEDVPYLIAKEKELNSMLAERAGAGGVTFVDTYTPSIGHDACALPTIRWVEPVIVPLMGFVIHPNVFGMSGMETATAAAIGP
ncbi:MAG TPA: SGNH/GDSL hydrolase family protein [Actinomycetota bacterium]|nr:SGNH/GDSL hydrolase family protein [Actinomycetota bacterium]